MQHRSSTLLSTSLVFTILSLIIIQITIINGQSTTQVCVEHVTSTVTGGVIDFAVPRGNSSFIYAISKSGGVWRVPSAGGTAVRILALNTIRSMLTGGEQGLLSIALHPNFNSPAVVPGSKTFYLFYTQNVAIGNDVISEWKLYPNETVNPFSERIIYIVIEPAANHNGGKLLFGKDDMLYATFGDGGGGNDNSGNQNNAQNPQTFLGKVIRVDIRSTSSGKNYTVPPTNPFYSNATWTPEVWAYGLRNPFRCSFDLADTTYPQPLYCGDVGQNAWEELTIVTAGKNMGWVVWEGTRCNTGASGTPISASGGQACVQYVPFSTIDPPVFQYYNNASSIMGGYIYRGSKDPRFYGKWFFGDYISCISWDSTNSRYINNGRCPAGTRFSVLAMTPPFTPLPYSSTSALPPYAPMTNLEYVTFVACPTSVCTSAVSNTTPVFQIWAFGEDPNNGDLFISSSNNGIWRMIEPSKCNITNITTTPTPIDTPTPTPVIPLVPLTSKKIVNPPVYCSRNGVLNVTLKVRPGTWSTQSFSFKTRTFEGSVPAPTLMVYPGDVLSITLQNELELPDSDAAENEFRYANSTNLHLHGLHVSPEGIADNIYRKLAPQSSMTWTYYISKDHISGTFWYHPHLHGSSALQTEGGMAGALLVLDPPDATSNPLAGIKEHVLLLQHVNLVGGTEEQGGILALSTKTGSTLPLNQQSNQQSQQSSDESLYNNYITVNGDVFPYLVLNTNETTRLRIINGQGSYFVNPVVPAECSWRLIAMDGVYLSAPLDTNRVILPPGARADVLIKCSSEGNFTIASDNTYIRDYLGATNTFTGNLIKVLVITQNSTLPNQTISNFPTTLPAIPNYLQDLLTATVGSQFAVLFEGPTNTINGYKNDMNRPLVNISLNTVYEWNVGSMDSKNHPYHQHVNHFQVVSYYQSGVATFNYTGLQVGMWRDTIPVSDVGVKIRFRPQKFTGKMIFHCHVTAHADQGMSGWAAVNGTEVVITPDPVNSTSVSQNFQFNWFCPINNPTTTTPSTGHVGISGSSTLVFNIMGIIIAVIVAVVVN